MNLTFVPCDFHENASVNVWIDVCEFDTFDVCEFDMFDACEFDVCVTLNVKTSKNVCI